MSCSTSTGRFGGGRLAGGATGGRPVATGVASSASPRAGVEFVENRKGFKMSWKRMVLGALVAVTMTGATVVGISTAANAGGGDPRGETDIGGYRDFQSCDQQRAKDATIPGDSV